MYYILIRYYFHEGTLHAKEDGPMVDGPWGPITVKQQWLYDGQPGWSSQPEYKRPMLFKTVDEARDYLAQFDITRQLSPQRFCEEGVYVTRHGEYERPDYWIRKCRTNNNTTIQGG